MFATLQFNPGDEEMTIEELTDKPPSLNQPFSHSACFSCRDKKLKCTGEKTGCERCRKRGTVCEYATASTDAGTGRRKSPRTASPRPNSPINPSSKKELSSKEKAAVNVQKNNIQGGETVSAPALSNVPVSLNSNDITNPPSTILPFPQMPSPDYFTMGNLTMDNLLDSTFDMPGFDADFNFLDSNISWSDLGTTPADTNPIEPAFSANDQTQIMLNSTQLSSNFRVQLPSSHFRVRDYPRNSPQLSLRSRSPKSEMPPTPRTDSTSALSQVCSCRDKALRILEVLQPQRMRKPSQAVLRQLHFTKNVINQCQEITQCASCIRVSSLMVLICVISENIVDVFEAVMLDWESKNLSPDTVRNAQQSLHAKTIKEGLFIGEKDYSFGDYRVDTPEEWLSLTGCLLLFQITRLDTILTAIQINAITADWESQLMILQPVFQRLKSIKNKL